MNDLNVAEKVLAVAFGVALVATIVCLINWAAYALWNAVLPPLFGWPMITFWQMLGLTTLLQIVFGFLRSSKKEA